MRFTFSKEIIDRYFVEGFGNYRGVKHYKVFDGTSLTGQFYFFDDAGFFRFEDRTVRLDRSRGVFKTGTDRLVDQESGHTLATCNFAGWSNSLGTLKYNNKEYKFRKGSPAVRTSLFDIKTWGHYKMILSNDLDGVNYDFQVKRTLFTLKKYNLHPYSGEIDTWGKADLLTVMTGLYLIERMLVLQDVE
jgi:hypothetical protein